LEKARKVCLKKVIRKEEYIENLNGCIELILVGCDDNCTETIGFRVYTKGIKNIG